MVDFFEKTQETIPKLNQTERELFNYVVKHMNEVKSWSIQKFADEKFLSTTTIFRFTQKLGFSGYSDFINSLLVTTHNRQEESLPQAIRKQGYNEAYLENIMETVRVMPSHQIGKIIELLTTAPSIYILTDEQTRTIAQYSERLFIGLGLHAYAPETDYQMQNLIKQIKSKDLLIALSYSGQNVKMIDFIERLFLQERPFLMSITRADNNALEGLSDANFYMFVEEIKLNNVDLTSCVPLLSILELLVYHFLSKKEGDNKEK